MFQKTGKAKLLISLKFSLEKNFILSPVQLSYKKKKQNIQNSKSCKKILIFKISKT